jgi:hypothetical protein
LWTANAVSNLGDGVTLVAGPLLAATMTRDPRLVAGLAVAQRLPWLLFALVAARAGLAAPFWCSFAAMAALTLACWPLLSSRAVAQAAPRPRPARSPHEPLERRSGMPDAHAEGLPKLQHI